MATCRDCNQDMKTADGCTVAELTCGGERFATFPFGRDPGWPAGRMERCGDCGARRGHLHHIGCDVQRCPRCRGQLISCDCRFDQFAGEYGDEDDDPIDDDDEDDAVGAPVVDLAAWPGRAGVAGSGPVGPPRGLVPFDAVAAPSRARHRALVRRIGESALARGRTFDLDVIAACLDVLEAHLGPEGTPLSRPKVNGVLWGGLWNWSSLRDTTLPDRWVDDLWTVLTALAAGWDLAPDSDPIRVLLEPLACYGRVGLDGEPLSDGEDVDFACQCYIPYDPDLAEGLGRLIVGRRRDDGEPLLAVARLQPRARPVDASDWLPWLALTFRVDRESERPARLPPAFVGAAPGDRHNPALWLYRPAAEHHDGGLLALDHDGRPHRVKADRRFRLGFRWVPESYESLALTSAGFHTTPEPPPEWW
jgi:hypothetical protein